MSQFELARRALEDLQEILEFVAEDSLSAADRLLEEFYRTFRRLAEVPGMAHKREDLTHRDVLFWTLYSYLISSSIGVRNRFTSSASFTPSET